MAPIMRDNDVLSHPTWKHSYAITRTAGREFALTFKDGQKLFFEPNNVHWPEIARTVAMWERMIEEDAR